MNRPSIKTICFLLTICLSIPYLQAQKADYREMFTEAESYFLYEEFTEALPLYIQLKEKFPENYNLDYKIGRCYLNMPYNKAKAVTHLEKAVKNMASVAKESNFKELNAPFDALFYLGDAYRINNQLDKAIETYESFKKTASSETYKVELVNDQIESCKRAKESEKRPVDIDKENIGNIINTRYSETNPVVSHDENMIIYAAKLPFYQAMFYSKKVNGKWTSPVNMIPELGVDDDCTPTSISSDGTELYVYRSNEYRGDIFVTNYQNGKWSKLRKLNSNINTKYWESHACISGDGKTLYFTSNREGGHGDLDIYKSERTSGDNWGPAVNLGKVINSEYNDDTPFISPDGSKLYFSSFGHETIGGYDLFVSEKNANGSWSKPRNLGYPVNSPDDELFLCPLRDGATAYISVYDPKGYGRFDIQRVKIYSAQNPRKYYVKGSIILPEGAGILNSALYYALFDKNKRDTVFVKSTNSNRIEFETVPGSYELIVKSDNIETQKVPLTILYGSKDIDRELTIKLKEKLMLAENKNNITSDKKAKSNDQLNSNPSLPDNDKNAASDNSLSASDNQLVQNTSSVLKANDDTSLTDNSEKPPTVDNTKDSKSQKDTTKASGLKSKIIPISSIGGFAVLFIVLLLLRKKKKNEKTTNTKN